MNNNKKKITTIVLLLAFLAIAVTGGTLAYFTDTKDATNVMTVGNVKVELYESKYHRGAGVGSYLHMTGQPVPLTDNAIIADAADYETGYLATTKLMPFDLRNNQTMFEECTVAKNAYVKNTGTNDCFVRVSYTVPENIAPYLDIYYVNTYFIKPDNTIATADARTLDNTDNKEYVITDVNISGTNFTLQGTTHDTTAKTYTAEFIYAERLTPGEMTLYSPVSKVTMIPGATSEQIEALSLTDGHFNIEVKVEAIQADGFLNAKEAFVAFDAQVTP